MKANSINKEPVLGRDARLIPTSLFLPCTQYSGILKGHTTIHTIKKHSKELIFKNF